MRASQKNMKPFCKSLLPTLCTFLLMCSLLLLHTPARAARPLLPSPPPAASTVFPLSLSLHQVSLLHPAHTARKLPETASSVFASLRRIPRSGPNPTQNKLKPRLRG